MRPQRTWSNLLPLLLWHFLVFSIFSVLVSTAFDLYGDGSPFAVKSGDVLEILAPENDAVLFNTTAIVELKAEVNDGSSSTKRLCVSLKNMNLSLIEASQCFTENFLTQVIFDNLRVGNEYQIKLSLQDNVQQQAVAIRSFRIGDIFGDTVDEAIEKAMHYHKGGDISRSKKLYTKILREAPQNPDALHLYGLWHLQFRPHKAQEAISLITKAIAIDSSNFNYYNSLGQVYERLSNEPNALKKAKEQYEKALEVFPGFITPVSNLLRLYSRSGQFRKVESMARPYLKDDSFIAQNLEEDRQSLLDSYKLYCESIQKQGKNRHAENCYEDAIAIFPTEGDLFNGLGNVQLAMLDYDRAAESYDEAVKLGTKEAILNAALMLEVQGLYEEASHQYSYALDLFDGNQRKQIIRLKNALLLPRIMKSMDSTLQCRKRMETLLDKYTKTAVPFSSEHNDPLLSGFSAGFYLSYSGPSSLVLKSKIYQLYVKTMPALLGKNYYDYPKQNLLAVHAGGTLQWDRTSIAGVEDNGGKIRVAFLSRFFWRHSIGKLMHGVIKYLRRDVFEVYILSVLPKEGYDEIFETIKTSADVYIELPHDLDRAREIVLGLGLDILVFPEISMDPFTYFISMSKLAKLQAVWWGHPETSGIPTIDYFISLDVEVWGSSSYYTERLYKMSGISTYYVDPVENVDENDLNHTRAKITLLDEIIGVDMYNKDDVSDIHIYTCAQSLFKMHPNHFDVAAAEILFRDESAHIVMIRGRQSHWTEIVLKRLAAEIGRLASRDRISDDEGDDTVIVEDEEDNLSKKMLNRIHFIQRRSHSRYLNMLLGSDVVLDTFPFGGGVSNLEALAVGTLFYQ